MILGFRSPQCKSCHDSTIDAAWLTVVIRVRKTWRLKRKNGINDSGTLSKWYENCSFWAKRASSSLFFSIQARSPSPSRDRWDLTTVLEKINKNASNIFFSIKRKLYTRQTAAITFWQLSCFLSKFEGIGRVCSAQETIWIFNTYIITLQNGKKIIAKEKYKIKPFKCTPVFFAFYFLNCVSFEERRYQYL